MLRPILVAPNKILRSKCLPVYKFDDELATLVTDMIDRMEASQGVGLAAPQLGLLLNLFVMQTETDCIPCVNPRIVSRSGIKIPFTEKCLSLPGSVNRVSRSVTIKLEFQDEHGKQYVEHFGGIQSVCAQHESDHLNGILFTDYTN